MLPRAHGRWRISHENPPPAEDAPAPHTGGGGPSPLLRSRPRCSRADKGGGSASARWTRGSSMLPRARGPWGDPGAPRHDGDGPPTRAWAVARIDLSRSEPRRSVRAPAGDGAGERRAHAAALPTQRASSAKRGEAPWQEPRRLGRRPGLSARLASTLGPTPAGWRPDDRPTRSR